MASDEKSLKRFSGEDDDAGKQLRKWKMWCNAKMATMKDLQAKQRGPWVYTLLDGKALEACEHLKLEDLMKENGDEDLWKLLSSRFPEKEPLDLMGESLGEVFGLVAMEGESAKQWTARVKEVCDRCARRASVDFPTAARGWLVLNCAGLSDEQKAIIKAKTQGKLEYDEVAAAFRSCFPMYKAPGSKVRRVIGAMPAEAEVDESSQLDSFDDVEAFLADHDAATQGESADAQELSEGEAAEALAVTWKERRQEISRVSKARKFGATRSLRTDINELKARTRCRKCNKLGHWARECQEGKSHNSGSKSSSHEDSSTGAGSVQFVGAAEAFVGHVASGLLSSPGQGIVDSGCGRTLIGAETLERMSEMLRNNGHPGPEVYACESLFRFGNGAVEKATKSSRIPVGIAGKSGIIDAAIISGKAPLLLGRPTLEKLKVQIDFKNAKITMLDLPPKELQTNAAGQIVIDMLEFGEAPQSQVPASSTSPQDRPVKKKITLKPKGCRCLLAQIKQCESKSKSKITVAELFSPPRFSAYLGEHGKSGRAYDLKTGYDLLDKTVQKKVDQELEELRPDLLIVSPPCTHEGGWDHLNKCFRSPLQIALIVRENRIRRQFCTDQIRKQLQRGGDFLLEHPWGSAFWDDDGLESLRRKYGIFRVDMCAYNLKCPDSNLPIRKATGLMCSRLIAPYMKQCPGCTEHQVVAGQLSNGMRRSTFVAKYTPQFVQSVLQALAMVGLREVAIPEKARLTDLGVECLAGEEIEPVQPDAVPEPSEQPDKIQQAVFKLHKNLGHPATEDLVRMLKHAGASSQAIKAAKELTCSVCANHVQASSALPANVPRVLDFNSQVGLDVKYLPSWKPGKTIRCVNIVDYASSLQIVVPIFQHETSDIIKGVLRDNWISWAGVPEFLITDPHKPNVGEVVASYCQDLGIKQLSTAAEAHFQLGKVERHGQWFQHIFERVCDQVRPSNDEEWIDCVIQTQTAKNSLISQSGASPYQHVFGRNPKVPHDLLQEEPDVAASDAVMLESPLARSQEIRQAARRSVLEAQDSRALRAALHAQPRPHKEFKSGDWVYYWRTQKWESGKLIRGGRWHGAAMVLGRIGRNLVVAHKRSLFRCAPEQLRFATNQEQQVAEFPESELLGIRNLLERGQFPKSQFTDLVSHGNPPEPEIVQQSLHDAAPRARTAAEVRDVEIRPETPERPSLPGSASDLPEQSMEPEGNGSQYAPVRYRHRQKVPEVVYQRPVNNPNENVGPIISPLIRPPDSLGDDFHEFMHDLGADQTMTIPQEDSPRGTATKREADAGDMPDASPTSRPRLHTDLDPDASLMCTPVEPNQKEVPTFSCYMASFLQKRCQKEIPPSGNEHQLQAEVDAAKTTEWETLIGKGAFQVWTGKKAAQIKREHADRFNRQSFCHRRKE